MKHAVVFSRLALLSSLLFLLSTLCPLPSALCLAREAPQVSVLITPQTAFIGDRVTVRVIVKSADPFDSLQVTFKAEKAEILSSEALPKKSQAGYTLLEHVTTIVFFETGLFTIGSFELTLRGEGVEEERITMEAREFTVQSVLKKEDTEIAPLKPLIEISGSPLHLLRYLALAALLPMGVLAWRLLRRNKKRPDGGQKIPLDPLSELESGLRDLEEKQMLARSEYRNYFIQLTGIWKRFLQSHYRFPAEDFTTSETLAALGLMERSPAVDDGMHLILEMADKVKFAKQSPEIVETDRLQSCMAALVGEYVRRRQAAEAKQDAAGQ